MRVRRTGVLAMGAIVAATTVAAAPLGTEAGAIGATPHDRRFDRIATFGVYTNNDDPAEQTVAEIADVSADGMTLIYTDSPGEQIGFVDIADPADPVPLGTLRMAGEPTSVATVGAFALVGVNTSESFTDPSGHLAVVDVESRSVVAEIPLAGQPDSVSTSPDGRYAAIAIENERDEDVEVDGVEGGLPQGPAGVLQIVDLVGRPAAWQVRSVELTGLAGYGSDDPEPEYVDIDGANRAVVTLQENNHVVVVDLRSGRILSDFPAGTVTLEGVDATEDGVISFTDTLVDVPREPDAVTWIDGNRFATANEGDLFGGSRGFTVFRRDGAVLFDSGASLEHLAATHGHYPEDRSENKGAEPEGITSARFGADDFLFVGSERGSFVAVYRVTGAAAPQFVQLLPTGLAPEGLLAIPERDLFVVTSEEDDPTLGVRATITIFRLGDGPAAYPQIVSTDADGAPIGWSALSGLATDLDDPATAYAVWDSYYAESRLFTLDVATEPARITGAVTLTDDAGVPRTGLDAEGVVQMPDGTFWIASEGNASDSRPNRLLHVAADGRVLDEVELPAEVLACRAATAARSTLGSGFEGVAHRDGFLYVAQQRGWDYTTPGCEHLDDDTSGLDVHGQPRATRIWVYDLANGVWADPIPYLLAEVPVLAAWVGLSEVVALPGDDLALIERDNRTGDWAELKTLVRWDAATGERVSTFDLLPAMRATNGWITDKPEGFGVAADGAVYVVTDNDGVEDWSGETQFLRLGDLADVLPGS